MLAQPGGGKALVLLRRVAYRFDLVRHVWHPALFWSAVYMILLSATVLAIARWA